MRAISFLDCQDRSVRISSTSAFDNTVNEIDEEDGTGDYYNGDDDYSVAETVKVSNIMDDIQLKTQDYKVYYSILSLISQTLWCDPVLY